MPKSRRSISLSSRRRAWQSSPSGTRTCAERAGKPEVMVQMCRSWTSETPSTAAIRRPTSSASMPSGAASSSTPSDSRSTRHELASTSTPIRTLTSGSA